jgi:hypothetical protein
MDTVNVEPSEDDNIAVRYSSDRKRIPCVRWPMPEQGQKVTSHWHRSRVQVNLRVKNADSLTW